MKKEKLISEFRELSKLGPSQLQEYGLSEFGKLWLVSAIIGGRAERGDYEESTIDEILVAIKEAAYIDNKVQKCFIKINDVL